MDREGESLHRRFGGMCGKGIRSRINPFRHISFWKCLRVNCQLYLWSMASVEEARPGEKFTSSPAVVFLGRDLTVFQNRYRIMVLHYFARGVLFSSVTVRTWGFGGGAAVSFGCFLVVLITRLVLHVRRLCKHFAFLKMCMRLSENNESSWAVFLTIMLRHILIMGVLFLNVAVRLWCFLCFRCAVGFAWVC